MLSELTPQRLAWTKQSRLDGVLDTMSPQSVQEGTEAEVARLSHPTEPLPSLPSLAAFRHLRVRTPGYYSCDFTAPVSQGGAQDALPGPAVAFPLTSQLPSIPGGAQEQEAPTVERAQPRQACEAQRLRVARVRRGRPHGVHECANPHGHRGSDRGAAGLLSAARAAAAAHQGVRGEP